MAGKRTRVWAILHHFTGPTDTEVRSLGPCSLRGPHAMLSQKQTCLPRLTPAAYWASRPWGLWAFVLSPGECWHLFLPPQALLHPGASPPDRYSRRCHDMCQRAWPEVLSLCSRLAGLWVLCKCFPLLPVWELWGLGSATIPIPLVYLFLFKCWWKFGGEMCTCICRRDSTLE